MGSSSKLDEKLNHPTIKAPDVQTDNQQMFEDEDDEIFMNLEVDCKKLEESSTNVQNPAGQLKVQKKAVRINTTVSKRVKYENSSSSDEENTSASRPDVSKRQQSSVQNPVKPVGIRKRNIF